MPIPEKFKNLIEEDRFPDPVTEDFLDLNPSIGLVEGILFAEQFRDLEDESTDAGGYPDFFCGKMVCCEPVD